ncbi:MAG: translocation/assembly module TamB domain-containing protein [Betaproteobacteria bacterium]
MRTRLFKVILWLAVLAVAVALGLVWLAGREWTLQTVLAELSSRSNGEIKVIGARGGLYDGLSFDRLEIRRPAQVVVLEQGVILWEPAMFLSRTLHVKHATIARISVEILKKSAEPAQEPASLELPFDLVMPMAKVGTIEIRDAGNTTRLSSLELGAQYAGKHWQIERAAIETPWGVAKATLALDATRPFALKSDLTFANESVETPYRLTANLTGKLAEIFASGSFSLKDATNAVTGSATATLAPFKSQPLARAAVKVPALSLRGFDGSLPEAQLAVDATLEPATGDKFKGVVSVVNSLRGTLDQERLPFASLKANFNGDAKHIDLADAVVDLGAGGLFKGGASYRNDAAANFLDRITLALNTQNLNLNGLHAKLRKTAIKGEANISPDNGRVKIVGTFREAKLALNIAAHADRQNLQVDRAELAAGEGKLALKGNMSLTGTREFQATGTLKKFNAAEFGDYPASDLNADLGASGSAGAPWRVKLTAAITQSRFLAQPLAGKVNLSASADALRDVDIALMLGANQFTARGGLGSQVGTDVSSPPATGGVASIAWSINAQQLAQLNKEFGGSLIAKGTASGALQSPRIIADLDATQLRFNEHRFKSVKGNAALSPGSASDAAISVDMKLDGYTSPKIALTSASVKLAGSRAAHTLELSAANTDFNVRLAARGALDAINRWRGDITQLDNRGSVPFSLLAAAPFVAAADGSVDLGTARFDVSGGKLEITQFRMANGVMATRGSGSDLPLAVGVPFSDALKRNIDTTLRLGAEWDIATSAVAPPSGATPVKVSGKLRLFRQSGDIRFLAEPPFAAGLDALDFKADVADNVVKATLAVSGKQLGRIDFTATTRAEQRGQTWSIPPTAPLQLQGEIDVPSLVWITRVAGKPGITLDGKLRATVAGTGTFGSPQLSGRASGSALTFAWPEHGIRYKDGMLEAEFSEDTLRVKQLTLASGEGNLEASGTLTLAGLKSSGKLTVKLDRFEAVSRPDRLVVASGEGRMDLDENKVSISANLKADRGFFELPEKSDVTISDDIVIVGKAPPAEKKENKMTTKVDLHIDLGRRFQIRGAGLDGRLAGTLHVVGAGTGLPRAVGTLNIEDGIYAVYGQKLTVVRGSLTFAGPIQNPGIDLYAVRKNPQPSLAGNTVEAGVEVRGSALAPRARLVSIPDVPETEKLSWLVLGRGLESSSQVDFSLLSTAASGLLGSSQAVSVQARIAGALGVDEFGISPPGSGQGGLLTLGKRISARLFVVYEQGLGKVSNIIKVRYTLSKRWSVQAQAGTESAVDALYTLSFD